LFTTYIGKVLTNNIKLMKTLFKLFLCGTALLVATTVNAQHKLTKLWESDTTLLVPESVISYNGTIYTSQIDGQPWGKDGKGAIGTLTMDGKIKNLNWITGLDAPKGLAVNGDWLYVADIKDVVVISISKNKIDHKITIADAVGLNDVTVDSKGVIYATDSQNARVFKIEKDVPTLYLEGLRGINGIKAIGDKLYILTGNAMMVADAAKNLTKFATLESGGDGVEPIGNGDFLVTAWAGWLYYVKADGTKEVLLDTHTTKNRKTADIGYDAKTKIVYVPTFSANSIEAYRLD
jgi:hypothetical protein